jgi:hypothetical protein
LRRSLGSGFSGFGVLGVGLSLKAGCVRKCTDHDGSSEDQFLHLNFSKAKGLFKTT